MVCDYICVGEIQYNGNNNQNRRIEKKENHSYVCAT
ncbi:hypothetical protein E2C01_042950 [Portunus trituberculatus]|uniref:Uncharacterized protein n=1 Tax=Portunus trituberculatus TaxID=210409 RepID=A0A5B7FUY8_PORTR|nr:hypothetical protein [Portunus trituberculatus]